jgi:hypothetical protein
MDWGCQPYWLGDAPQGPELLAHAFPRLEVFSLIFVEATQVDKGQVRECYSYDDEENRRIKAKVKSTVRSQFRLVELTHPGWRVPQLQFCRRKEFLQEN